MRLEKKNEFREPTPLEQALLKRLLEADFPGRNELTPMLRNVLVRTIDQDGSLELHSRCEGTAPVVKRIPVEAEAKDEDGVLIHVLLHVIDGRPLELEFVREDARTVKRLPEALTLELILPWG